MIISVIRECISTVKLCSPTLICHLCKLSKFLAFLYILEIILHSPGEIFCYRCNTCRLHYVFPILPNTRHTSPLSDVLYCICASLYGSLVDVSPTSVKTHQFDTNTYKKNHQRDQNTIPKNTSGTKTQLTRNTSVTKTQIKRNTNVTKTPTTSNTSVIKDQQQETLA